MNRQQRRAVKSLNRPSPPALVGISKVAEQLEGFLAQGTQMGAVSEQLVHVLEEVQDVQAKFEKSFQEFEGTHYELEMQRWVSLRLASTVHPIDPKNIPALFQLEVRYRAEYDAMKFLVFLAQLAQS